MNDLHTLGAALAEDDPAQDVVDRSRHRLRYRIDGGRTFPRRSVWLTVGTGLTVTAAAAAVAISVVPNGSPEDGPARTGNAASTDTAAPTKTYTAREVLLAAATAAERAPDDSGTYWYVKVTTTDSGQPADVWETWTTADGHEWFRGVKSNRQVVPMGMVLDHPFAVPATTLTLDQLRALPTEPEALKAAIATAVENGGATTSGGPLTDNPELLARAKFDALVALVSTLPAPPAVRAGAFRAIASYPGVEDLGPVPGGQGLLFPGDQRFVVDPETGRVNGTTAFVSSDGAEFSAGDSGHTFQITAEWTDTPPS